MQVYLLRGSDDEGALRPADGFEWAGRGGVPFFGRWPEPLLAGYSGVAPRALDCLGLSAGTDGVVISSRAAGVLAPFFAGSAEVLPVRLGDARYYWINVLSVVDSLGPDLEGEWLAGFLVSVRRLVFRQDRLLDAPGVFRVPALPAGYLFVRDGVVEAVLAAGLTGFRFDLVWSLVGGGVLDAPGLGILG